MTSNQVKNCFVQFQLYQKTSPGEEIHVTGNTPSLGQWNVNQSEKMITSNDEYPTWKSRENILVPQDTEIQYKYLIFYNKKFKSWENNENRRVKIGKYCKVVIKDPGSQIINSVSDPNLSNISNSEISKTENPFNDEYSKLIGADDIELTNNNDLIFSEQNTNTINYEEQFILSNKKNDLILPNVEKDTGKFSKDLNNEDVSDLNQDLKTNIEFSEYNTNNENEGKIVENDINIKNIINESTPINSQIFNNILKNDRDDSVNTNIEKSQEIKSDINQILIKNDFHQIELNNTKNIYNKIIICSLYLPIEIKDNKEIIPLSDYIYPNLFELYKNNKNIYFIGLIKNSKNIEQKNKEEIYTKLKNDYRMFPLDINEEFKKDLIKYFNDIANPFLNDVPINISNIKNNNINTTMEKIHIKFNEIIYQAIINIAKDEKFLLMLFDYYFAFVPQIIKKNNENKLYNDIGIQYIMLNKICSKDRFIKFPYYKNIIKSLLYSNIIIFPSYYNCYQFLNLAKLYKEYEYKVNIEGDIIINNKDDEPNNNQNHNIILKAENIFPDYQLFKSIINENNECSELKKIVLNIKKKENNFLFLSIDDIKYLPFIKIKLLGLKSFIENISDEKYKISFIQVITGESEYFEKNQETNVININNNININEEKKEIEKDSENEINLSSIISMINEINSNYDNKIIEIIPRDINLHEKIFLLNNADCFIKTLDDINSPFCIYEYLMTKIIYNEKNLIDKEKNNNINQEINIKKEKLHSPIVEYIIGNQIKEIPGLNKYIHVNPYEIQNISSELSKAFRNLINCHKNINANYKEHSKTSDFNFIKKYFDIEKIHFNKINEEKEKSQTSYNKENINEILEKIETKEIIKCYEGIIKNSQKEGNKDKICKIIAINIDFFLDMKHQENVNDKRIYILLSNIISLALNCKNNKIILFSNKDESELDPIIEKFISDNDKKYETSFLLLNNIIIASSSGYSFKKLSAYKKEGENQWIKFLIDFEYFPFSDREILNILLSYKDNCSNIKIQQKSNKIYIYNDDCNKDQLDLYIEDFKNIINNEENYKNFLLVNKIENGYCIKNILNYRALFISKILKEMIASGKKPKFIVFFGYNKYDEILYDYFYRKKLNIEGHIKEETFIYCLKLINKENYLNKDKEINNSEEKIINNYNSNYFYTNLYYNDEIDEIISLFKTFADLESNNSK